jgi:hypothetical protein
MVKGVRDFGMQSKEVDDVHRQMGGTCGTHKGNAKCILENLKGRDNSVNLDVH